MRRSRIKVTANLSTTRRSTNKSSGDSQNSTTNGGESTNDDVNSQQQQKPTDEIPHPQSVDLKLQSESKKNDCASILSENSSSLNEAEPVAAENDPNVIAKDSHEVTTHSNEPATFKTPLQMPRAESDSSGSSAQASTSSNKFRRFKIAPRLNTSRNVTKFQVNFSFSQLYN